MRNVLLALTVLAATLAGCAADGPDEPTDEELEESQSAIYDAIETAIGAPLLQSGPDPSRPNELFLERIAAVTGEAGREPVAEGYVETAVKNGYAYLCRSGPEGGLAIFDVRDIETPVFTGFLALEAGFEPDIEVTDDGRYAFWEVQRAGVPTVPDPTSPGGSLPRGIHVIDVSDKSAPAWVSYTPVEIDGPHSITYANISGEDYVFASIYSWQYVGTSVGLPPLAPPGIQRLSIYRLADDGTLAEVSTYVDPDAAEPNPVMPEGGKMPHDVSIAVHPITKRTYAYVAYWNLGVVILDVTDPAHPTKVGAASDFGAAASKEIHMARQSEGLIDGRVIVVAEPEIGQQETTGYMSMIDVTDPTAPVFVSNWKIPGESDSAGGGRGPHYFDLREGRVALASYSAGFWVFDIHDRANLEQPRTVGYSFSQGSAFDAWWADPTHVVASDGGGLVVFRYTGPTPALDEQVTAFTMP
ncbi:MAG: hypothetical protein AABY18_03140 [Candidatus Thermoplasmatota archaeon]